MAINLQNLNQQFPIVDPKTGKPTDYFMSLLGGQLDKLAGLTGDVQTDLGLLAAAQLQAGAGIGITPDGHLLSNPTISVDTQAVLDEVTTTRGSVLYRGDTGWAALSPGSSGQFLKSNGAGADPSWATVSGGGGGTTDSMFYDPGTTASYSASGTSQATKGSAIYPLTTVLLEGIFTTLTTVVGATYRARVYRMAAFGASTIAEIIDNGVDYVATEATALRLVYLPFSSTVSLSAKVTYAIAVSRTDGGDTYALPCGVGSGKVYFKTPIYVDQRRVLIAKANPIVGDSCTTATGDFDTQLFVNSYTPL